MSGHPENPAAHLTLKDLLPGAFPGGLQWLGPLTENLASLSDNDLTTLHGFTHQEWMRRYPAGNWPWPEQNMRATERAAEERLAAQNAFQHGQEATTKATP